MAVLLSPVGGVAGQFFDNNGNPLTGGKMYSYVAGTTTPQATYTSSAGAVAHSNPIILDAGGRVPGGEIWLTDGLQYKFVLKNANDVLIGTYDNIIGINSNFVNFLTETEVQTATAGQTVFTLATMQYQPGTNNLTVYVDGVNQIDGATYSYVETSSTVITFTAGLHVGALVKFTTAQTLSTGVTDAALVTYDPPFANSVTTTVENKLAQYVSVTDFGAVGDGVADDTVAIQAALDTSHSVLLPQGTYKITAQLVFGASCSGLTGEGMYLSVISKEFNGNAILCDTSGAIIENLGIDGNGASYTGSAIVPRGYNILIQHCRINDTEDSPIKVAGAVGSNALAATYLRVDNCFLNPTNAATTYAIRSITPDDAVRPTGRVFSNLSGGSSLVDFSGMNYAVLENSLGTIIKFDANSAKIIISNNRFTLGSASITIYGVDHIIDSNAWGFGAGQSLILDSTATNVFFGPNNPISIDGIFNQSIVQNQAIGLPNANTVYSKLLANPTLPWFGSVTNPVIGNGSFSAYYQQDGRTCLAQVSIIVNNTTTIGSGSYTFKLPFEALVTESGSAVVKSSSGDYYPATVQVQGGSSDAYIILPVGISPQFFASTSLVLSTNATIDFSITYLIQTN